MSRRRTRPGSGTLRYEEHVMTLNLPLSLTVVLALACLPACGPADEASRRPAAPEIKVGLLLDDLHERWQRDRALFVEVAEDMKATTLVEAAEGDMERQLQQAERMLDDGAQVLVVVAHDTERAADIVKMAKERNVNVIAYDRLIRNADVDLYLGFDATRIGQMQAQHLVQRAPKGNYLLIGGSPTDINAKLLREGQMKVLEPHVKSGAIRIVGDGWAEGWRAEDAARLTREALKRSRNNLTAIVASNDVTAGGAIGVLEEQGLAGKVLVSGQDAELDAVRRIVDGTQTMTVYKSLRTLTRLAARSAVLMARGEPVDSSSVVDNGYKEVPALTFDPIAVDKGNIDGVLIADGFHTREEVYRGS
jgi:D-xylose transport system substrate-binding protein